MMNPPFAFVSGSQMLPTKWATPTTFSPSSERRRTFPSRTCQAMIPSHSPSVGAWAKVHGQGTLHRQKSTKSPAHAPLLSHRLAQSSLELKRRTWISSHCPAPSASGFAAAAFAG